MLSGKLGMAVLPSVDASDHMNSFGVVAGVL